MPDATKNATQSSQTNSVEKPSLKLVQALQTVLDTKHPYVNPTLKRLARAANQRMAKL